MGKQSQTLPDESLSAEDADSSIPEEIDHAAEKRLVRKLDLYIVPLVMLLYLLSFLDRSAHLSGPCLLEAKACCWRATD